MPITPAAAAWITGAPALKNVLIWHARLCQGCYRREDHHPVRCPEWAEIIADYDITALTAARS